MNDEEKEKLLKERLTILKNNLETANFCINSAIETLDNLEDFKDLLHNWEKYMDIFKK
ncbi:MAG: hypothetical protein UR30_C0005G0112 [Candidatus Peregrinibacteria bacterium GW2011_GWC2_33_13]|nr:MAG: hypothetical protein UR30_C0005G0112 [Candidatus Peregrinibacteria bacterium GW2011_GWC2_33_13]